MKLCKLDNIVIAGEISKLPPLFLLIVIITSLPIPASLHSIENIDLGNEEAIDVYIDYIKILDEKGGLVKEDSAKPGVYSISIYIRLNGEATNDRRIQVSIYIYLNGELTYNTTKYIEEGATSLNVVAPLGYLLPGDYNVSVVIESPSDSNKDNNRLHRLIHITGESDVGPMILVLVMIIIFGTTIGYGIVRSRRKRRKHRNVSRAKNLFNVGIFPLNGSYFR